MRNDIYTPESAIRRRTTTCCGNCPLFARELGKAFSGACLGSLHKVGDAWVYDCVSGSRPIGLKDCCGKVSR